MSNRLIRIENLNRRGKRKRMNEYLYDYQTQNTKLQGY